MEKGLVHIYHGDGKGKTTCAVGLAIRALGAGYQVIFAQFLKGGLSSELSILESLKDIEIIRCKKEYGFTWELSEQELKELQKEHNLILEQVLKSCQQTSQKTLVVFDELCATYQLSLLDKEMLIRFIKNRSDNLEVVITGRNPAPELLEVADYISEIQCVRHPMEQGIASRIGIEM